MIAPDAVWNGLFTFLKPELFKTPAAGRSMIRRLLAILGRRTMLTFGLVTFLVGALLATVNITSRYALKVYVDDQLKRIPWDLAVYQQGAVNGDRTLHESCREDTRRDARSKRWPSCAHGFRRAARSRRRSTASRSRRRGSVCWPLPTPASCRPSSDSRWLATERPAPRGAVLSLVGPEYAMGKAFLALQGAKNFTLQVHVEDQPRFLFNTPLQSVVRLDRDDLNRWLMDQTGSVSYIPYIGAILLMPYDWNILTKFDQVATGFVPDDVLGVGNEEAGHIQMAEYAPEVVYVARIDRPSLISGWDIPGSLARVETINKQLHRGAIETAPAPEESLHGPARAHARCR